MKTILAEELDLDKNKGKWIINLQCPYCGDYFSTILKQYNKSSGPAPLIHIVDDTTKHYLDVEDLKAYSWFDIRIFAKRRDTGEAIIYKGNLSGQFFRAPSE